MYVLPGNDLLPRLPAMSGYSVTIKIRVVLLACSERSQGWSQTSYVTKKDPTVPKNYIARNVNSTKVEKHSRKRKEETETQMNSNVF